MQIIVASKVMESQVSGSRKIEPACHVADDGRKIAENPPFWIAHITLTLTCI